MEVFVIVVLALVACSPSAEANHCPMCNKWTPFFNRDKPTNLGDFELLILHKTENPGQICAAPELVNCRRLTGPPRREIISIAADHGLSCYNFLQPDGQCEDYKCRYCCNYRYPSCPRGYRWTRYYNRDRPTGTGDYETLSLINQENPYARVCTDPIAIDVRVTRTGFDYSTAGEVVCLVPELGFSCVDAQQPDGQCQDYKIRFCCPNNY